MIGGAGGETLVFGDEGVEEGLEGLRAWFGADGLRELHGCGAWGCDELRRRFGGADGLHGGLRCGGFGEECENFLEFVADGYQVPGIDGLGFSDYARLRLFGGTELGFEGLASSGDGVALVVEEGFDAEGHFYVATAVEALAGASLIGLELREFALPEAQDVGGYLA
jgi:hypothetical protein